MRGGALGFLSEIGIMNIQKYLKKLKEWGGLVSDALGS